MDRYFNIDPYYSPVYGGVDPEEDERRYYERSRQLVDAIIQAHKYEGGTILLSGHAGSIEALTRGMMRRRARPERLLYEAERVNYCNFAILERDARSHQWVVHSPGYGNESYHTAPQRIRSTIPLYSATSQYTMAGYFRDSSFSSKKYLYGNRSFSFYPY